MKINSLNIAILIAAVIITVFLLVFKLNYKISQETLVELPFIILSTFLLISPYLFLIFNQSNRSASRQVQIIQLITSLIVSIPAVAINYYLLYLNPDPQNGIGMMALIISQWLIILASINLKNYILKRER
jgi:hypothetical protein